MRMQMPGRFLPKGTDVEWARFRIPEKVKELVRGTTIFFPLPAVPGSEAFVAVCVAGDTVSASMRTKNFEYAELRRTVFKTHLNQYTFDLLAGPKSITHKQLVALGGDVYKKITETFGENPGDVSNWIAMKALGRAVREGRYDLPPELDISAGPKKDVENAHKMFGIDLTAGIDNRPIESSKKQAMEKRYGLLTSWVLQERGVIISPEDRIKLLDVVHDAVTNASIQLKKNARNDYSPDPNAAKYPNFEHHRDAFTIDMLFEKWKEDGKGKSPKSIANTAKMVERLRGSIGNKDISEIDKLSAVKWRDQLKSESGIALQSVNQHLTMMGALFNIAIRDQLYKGENPFKGISFRGVPRAQMDRYNDDEVRELLKIARKQADPAKRWLPWLSTCMGARIGELAQLYKANVIYKNVAIPYVEITVDPDNGRMKNNLSPRRIPLHPVLIKEGFLEFIDLSDEGPLFYKVGRKTEKNAAFELVAGSMSHWIRSLGFKDPKKAPNHAFRLWWRTAASAYTNSIEIRRYLFGHDQQSVEAGYNVFSIDQTDVELRKIIIPVPD